MRIDQQTHQLGNGEHRMGVVQMHRHLLRQPPKMRVRALIAADQILHRCGDKEVFLAQTQFAAGLRGVVRIQQARYVFRGVLRFHRAAIIALVERGQVEFIGRPRRPEAQRVGRGRGKTGDHGVVRHGVHVFRVDPFGPVAMTYRTAAEMDHIVHFRARKLPRIARAQPVIGRFDLIAVHDGLPEHAVFVADAIAEAGNADGRHGVEETRGKAAEATVTEGRIRLQVF
jgi:hypothetical protein